MARHAMSIQASLIEKEAASLPVPSDLRLKLMVDRLAQLDELEAQSVYLGASPEDQRTMELASLNVGRLPKKSGERVAWSHLIDPTLIT